MTAPTSDVLLDRLAADWYVDLVTHRASSNHASAMMAENHAVRRELITRAQTLLRADGTLTGDGVQLGESEFHVGERVITRVQHDTFRFDDRTKLRNGTLGTVTDIHRVDNGQIELTVRFDTKGPVRLDHAFDPHSFAVAHASQRDVASLRACAPTDPIAAQALQVAADRAAVHALINPPAVVVERVGPRPPATDPARPIWDKGVTDLAKYWEIGGR